MLVSSIKSLFEYLFRLVNMKVFRIESLITYYPPEEEQGTDQ